MNEDLPKRIYEIRFLNDDLAKSNDDRMLGTDVRISQSGAIELNQIFTDSDSTHKIFYQGEYYVREMPMEEFLELKEHGYHHHGEDEDNIGDIE